MTQKSSITARSRSCPKHVNGTCNLVITTVLVPFAFVSGHLFYTKGDTSPGAFAGNATVRIRAANEPEELKQFVQLYTSKGEELSRFV